MPAGCSLALKPHDFQGLAAFNLESLLYRSFPFEIETNRVGGLAQGICTTVLLLNQLVRYARLEQLCCSADG